MLRLIAKYKESVDEQFCFAKQACSGNTKTYSSREKVR